MKIASPISTEMRCKMLFEKHFDKDVWVKFRNNHISHCEKFGAKPWNFLLDYTILPIKTAPTIVRIAFNWSATPEGLDYWNDIDTRFMVMKMKTI